jgi:phosphate transport system substrate-binding protein
MLTGLNHLREYQKSLNYTEFIFAKKKTKVNLTQYRFMKTNHTLTCQRCKYNFNPLEVRECVICGYPLKKPSISPKYNLSESNKPKFQQSKPEFQQRPSRLLTFQFLGVVILSYFLLTVLLGGGYLFWLRQDQLQLFMPQVDGDSVSDSEIKSYPTMQEVPNVPSGLFNYGGATCFAALTKYGMNKAITKAHAEYQLRYTEPLNSKPGCSTGIEMLLNSELSFAQNGRPLQDHEYAKARSRDFTLKQIPVAIDGIVFFVNPRLPISGLSINQLKDIFQGKITNWQQVGGPNLPIAAISQDPTVHITINSLLNNGEQLGKNVAIVRDYTTAMRQVATTPGSISYSSAAIARGQKSIRGLGLALGDSQNYVAPFTKNGQVNLNALRDGSYPLTRRLFVVVRHDSTTDEQAGIAYANLLLTAEGQQIVKKAGFVPLR